MPDTDDQIRQARPDEYEKILRFLCDAYGGTPEVFSQGYPTVWREETTDFRHIYLICDGDEILSLVRVFPLDMVLGGAKVKVGAIGAVGTLPAARGKGCMSRLMNHAISRMKSEGMCVSILWGYRHRYQNYGYEIAGKTFNLTVERRGLDKTGIAKVVPQTYSGQPELLEKIVAAYETHPYRSLRSQRDWGLAFQRTGVRVFCAGKGRDFGYLAIRGKARVMEFGGDERTVLGIADYAMEQLEFSSVFPFPAKSAIPEAFLRAASFWSITDSGYIRVVDTARTVSLFLDQNRPAAGIDVGALERLSQIEQAEALFGTLWDSPFNIFIWPLDHV